jgi:hypothetical protein
MHTCFWVVFHISSDAKLLVDIRAQVASITSTVILNDGITVNQIGLRKLRSETVVFSAAEEASRYRATGVDVHYIIEDTVVSEGDTYYYLKKGG